MRVEGWRLGGRKGRAKVWRCRHLFGLDARVVGGVRYGTDDDDKMLGFAAGNDGWADGGA